MNAKEVADKLKKLSTKTPKTLSFENKDGEKFYGQKNNRWWDDISIEEGMSRQQYHVVAYFMCQYYHGSGYSNTCKDKCNTCYLKESYKNNTPINNVKPWELYSRMKRPEMYIWIMEALKILDDNKLEKCIDEIKCEMDKSPNLSIKNIRDIISKKVTWEDIEAKLNEL